MKSFKETVQRDAIALRQHNDELPISRLPSEILCRIFRLSFDTLTIFDLTHRYYYILQGFMNVCYRWYSLVRHEPSFWTFLSSYNSEGFIRELLERSKSSLLDVYLNVNHLLNPEIPPPTPFISIITQHAGRLRSATLVLHTGIDWSQPEQNTFASSFPALQSMGFNADVYLNYALKDALRLRSMSLIGVSLLSLYIHPNRLTWLEYDSPPETGSMRAFLDFIAASPSLVGLLVKAAYFVDDVENIETIHLPSLRTLELSSLRFNILERIVSTIEAPNCRQIFLLQTTSHSGTSKRYSYLFQMFRNWMKGNFASLTGTRRCWVQFWRRTVSFQYPAQSADTSRSFKFQVQSDLFSTFISEWADFGPEDLEVALLPLECDLNQRDFLPSLARLPNLRSLQIEDRALMQPVITILGAQQQPPPFPCLQSILFVPGGQPGLHLNAILEMVRSRYSPEATHPPLLKLTFLYEIADSENILQQMESILGKGRVTCIPED